METSLAKLTPEEQGYLQRVYDCGEQTLEIIIPIDMEAGEVLRFAAALGKASDNNESERALIAAALGRVLYIARTRPDVIAAAGCENIKEFEGSNILGKGAGRSSIWKMSAGYIAYPEMTPYQAAEIGSTNLALAVQVSKGLSDKQKKETLKAAKELRGKPGEFRDWIEKKSLAGKDELITSSFTLYGSKAEIDELREHLGDMRFIQLFEDDKPIRMILSALHNCLSELPNDPPSSRVTMDAPEVIEATGMVLQPDPEESDEWL